MAEKTKAEIAAELAAEYRATIKRTADEEDALSRQGTFRAGGKKSMNLAYLFWFLVGGFGIHRFYLGRPLSGAGMLALMIASVALTVVSGSPIVGLVPGAALSVWWLVDAFQIPKMVP